MCQCIWLHALQLCQNLVLHSNFHKKLSNPQLLGRVNQVATTCFINDSTQHKAAITRVYVSMQRQRWKEWRGTPKPKQTADNLEISCLVVPHIGWWSQKISRYASQGSAQGPTKNLLKSRLRRRRMYYYDGILSQGES